LKFYLRCLHEDVCTRSLHDTARTIPPVPHRPHKLAATDPLLPKRCADFPRFLALAVVDDDLVATGFYAREFAKSRDLDYPILIDPGGSLAKSMGCCNGRFSSRWTYYVGKDGKILYIDKKVKAGDHGTDIVAKLSELKIEKKK